MQPPQEALSSGRGLPSLVGRLADWGIACQHRVLGSRVGGVVAACLLATAIAFGAVLVERLLGRGHRQSYLLFNLFLAWIPLGLALVCDRMSSRGRARGFRYWGCATAWLLFLPNCPYIYTDLVHLMGRSLPYYWPDMMKILLFAFVGFSVGMVSLQLMHQHVEERFGWCAGWGFSAGVLALCSVGVYLGRFRRWNSWDALNDPKSILRDAATLMNSPWVSSTTGQFCVQLFLFSFCGYVILRAMGTGGRRDPI